MKALELPGFEDTLCPPVQMPAGPHGRVTREQLAGVLENTKRKKRSTLKDAAELFEFQLRSYRLPEFEREHRFAKPMGRQWRFDFANRAWKLAIEVEGLVVRRIGGELVVMGRHASISGFKDDAIKYASAAILGWTVLRFEQSQVKNGTAIKYTQHLLVARGWQADV